MVTTDALEVEPEVALQRLIRTVETSVPGLSLSGVVGELRPAGELFPEHAGDPGPRVDPRLQLREIGVVLSYEGDEGWGFRGTASSDPSIGRWAEFATHLLASIQEVLVDSTTEAWPEVSGGDGRALASPGAIVENGVLHMWYGERLAPVLAFAPVRLIR